MEKIMNREIKFRVWNNDISKWEDNGGLGYILSEYSESDDCLNKVFDNSYAELIFQQFTGFLDKKGKEIYEGDIIDTRVSDDCIPDLEKHKYTLIVFFSDNGSWEAKEKMDQFSGSCFPFHSDHYKILLDKTKVIGNIFENPDLLK